MKIMILGFTMIYHTLVAGLQVQSPETHGYHQKNGTAKITPSHRFQSLLLGQNPLPPGLLWWKLWMQSKLPPALASNTGGTNVAKKTRKPWSISHRILPTSRTSSVRSIEYHHWALHSWFSQTLSAKLENHPQRSRATLFLQPPKKMCVWPALP